MSKQQKRVLVVGLALLVALWVVLQTMVATREEARLARQVLMLDAVQLEANGGALAPTPAEGERAVGVSAEVDPKAALAEAMASRLRHLSACVMTADGSRAPMEVVLTKEDGGWQVSAVAVAQGQADDLACVQAALGSVRWPDLPGDLARLSLISWAEGGQDL